MALGCSRDAPRPEAAPVITKGQGPPRVREAELRCLRGRWRPAPTPAGDFSNGAVPAAPPARSHDFAVLRDLALHGTLLHTALLNPFKNFMAAYKCRKLFMVLRGQALPPPLQQRMSSPPPPTCEKRFHTWAGGGGVCVTRDRGLTSAIKMLMFYLKAKTFDF